MSKIPCNVVIRGNNESVRVRAVIDAGVRLSLVRGDLARQIYGPQNPLRTTPLRIRIEKGGPFLEADSACLLALEMKGVTIYGCFQRVDDLPEELIIGENIIRDEGIRIDPVKGDYAIVPDPDRYVIGECA